MFAAGEQFADMQVYLGTDMTAISRIERLLQEYPDRFREFAFTADEQSYCESAAHPAQHYAARWAVKEAYIKSVDGFDSPPDLRSIEVEPTTPPRLSLTGDGEELLDALMEDGSRDAAIDVSLGHERRVDLAFATVVVLVH